MTKEQTIHREAINIINQNPQGIQFSDLRDQIRGRLPHIAINTIIGNIGKLTAKHSQKVTKLSVGLYAPVNMNNVSPQVINPSVPTPAQIPESSFYRPFADYLLALGEITVAESLGGSGLKSRWGTPDVVGAYKPTASDRVKFPIEFLSAEIKTATDASVTAFGQAVAYRLFSTKVYVVMPKTMPPVDQHRLESLCMLFGVGLVTFDVTAPTLPGFTTVIRAQRFSPDMFYVNVFANEIHRHNLATFNKLFS